jgi:hypothetical protein
MGDDRPHSISTEIFGPDAVGAHAASTTAPTKINHHIRFIIASLGFSLPGCAVIF